MNGVPDLLIRVLNEVTEAAAIIDGNHRVAYSNDPFRRLFHFTPDLQGKKRCEALRPLNLRVRNGKVESCLQKGTVTDGGRRLDVVVYLINTLRDRGPYFLLLFKDSVRKKRGGTGTGASSWDGVARADVDKNIHFEKLAPEFRDLIGEDIKFKQALLIAQKAARSDLPVLIIGESGTGKELLARAIHRTSRRSGKPLVDVNCAAIPDTLIESELFGYEKGAFTGARAEGRTGYFDEAHEGTLLMDEIGDASLQTQSKLLRVLEDGSFKRVGGNRNVKVNVRIISSTNRSLTKLIAEKAFREDLYYRLNTFTIYVPPLRDRPGDIPLLVNHFLITNIEREKKNFRFLPASMEILYRYRWPGNVRELKGVVNYAVNMASGAAISPSSLPNFLFSQGDAVGEKELPLTPAVLPPQTSNLAEIVENVEKDHIRVVLENSANRTEAIRRLRISRRTFYAKLKQYDLDKPGNET